uniref:Uncharacterized protein n=1 Tax=Rhizophora mucronata TaxID=61149 RepID=A0A2P2QKA5_RHIMU
MLNYNTKGTTPYYTLTLFSFS